MNKSKDGKRIEILCDAIRKDCETPLKISETTCHLKLLILNHQK